VFRRVRTLEGHAPFVAVVVVEGTAPSLPS